MSPEDTPVNHDNDLPQNSITDKANNKLVPHTPKTLPAGDSNSLDTELGNGRRKKLRRSESEKGKGMKWKLG